MYALKHNFKSCRRCAKLTSYIQLILQVSECVNISRKHAFKTLFSCVRAFTQDGNKVQQCQKMSAITNIQPSDVVYDFDANTNMWNNIKEVCK